MADRDRIALPRLIMRGVLALTGLLALTLLAVSILEGSFGRMRAKVLLTFLGLAIGALLGVIQLRASKAFRKTLIAALAAIGELYRVDTDIRSSLLTT